MEEFCHLLAAKIWTPLKVCFSRLPQFFLDKPRQTEVDEDWLLIGRTEHDVLWLYVLVHQLQPVQDGQVLVDDLLTEILTTQLLACFQGEIDTVLIYEEIKAKTFVDLGAALQDGGHPQYKPLLDDPPGLIGLLLIALDDQISFLVFP